MGVTMIKLLLANKPKYREPLEQVLQDMGHNPALLEQAHTVWFLFVEDDKPIGAAYVFALSDVRLYITMLFKDIKLPGRKAVGKDLLKYLEQNSSCSKYEVIVPTDSKNVLRYYSQLGFKREGVSRQSARIGDELVDQVHMGFVCQDS